MLALRRGVGGVSPLESVLLGIAALGIVGWQIADDPIVATCSVVAADIIGMALMLPKTYGSPGSETVATFAIGGVSTLFALVAVESADAGARDLPGLHPGRGREPRHA